MRDFSVPDLQTQNKVFEVDFSKGYGYGENAIADLPAGCWTGVNMASYSEIPRLETRRTWTEYNDFYPNAATHVHALASGVSGSYVLLGDFGIKTQSGASVTTPTWAGGGSAVTFTSVGGTFAECASKLVCCGVGKSPVTAYTSYPAFTQYNYTTASDLGFTGGICCSHENRVFIRDQTTLTKLWYSDVGNSEAGYTGASYVNIGGDGFISGLHELCGSLVVIKNNSIWKRFGHYSDLDDTQFMPIYTDAGTTSPNASIVAEGNLYFANSKGLFVLSGTNVQQIPFPGKKIWNSTFTANSIYLSYWQMMGWIIITPGYYCYDIRNGRWLCFDSSYSPYQGANIPGTFITVHNSRYVKTWNALTTIGAGQKETSLASNIQHAFTDFGNPFSWKMLKSVRVVGHNHNRLLFYLRGDNVNVSPSADSDLTQTGEKSVYVFPPDRLFKSISCKIDNSDNAPFMIDRMIYEYEEIQI